MRSSRPFRRSPRRGALPAALALFALFVQLLIPAASLAHEAQNRSQTVVICTLDGAKTVVVPGDGPAHGFGGLKCHDCVMASVAAVQPGDAATVPVRYATEARLTLTGLARPQARSRAPPRPPSTAPPQAPTA
ncbi:hypothetical protein MCEMIH16_01780 [Caulobacteraceae bacterium]